MNDTKFITLSILIGFLGTIVAWVASIYIQTHPVIVKTSNTTIEIPLDASASSQLRNSNMIMLKIIK